MSEDLDRLFAAWMAGPLDDAQSQALLHLLRDPGARQRWRELTELDGALAELGAATRAEPAVASPNTTRRVRRQQARRRPLGWAVAGLAASLLVMLGGGVVWLLQARPDPTLPSQDGHRLARGTAVSGPAILMWDDGSRAELAATASVSIPTQDQGLILAAGEVTFSITHREADQAFTVTSPEAEIAVVGTRFSLRRSDATTSLVVTDGSVRFRADGRDQLIPAGQSASSGPGPEPRAGLVAWWPLSEGSGDSISDASGGFHAGQAHDCRWVIADGRPCLQLAGGNASVEIAATGALATLNAGDYTVVASFRPAELPRPSEGENFSVIVGRTGWTSGLHLDGDGRFFMQHFLADQTPVTAQSQPLAEIGRWHHLIGIVDRTHGETRLAIDGRLVARAAWTAGSAAFAYPVENPWRMGLSTPGDGPCRWAASGELRDVRLYDRALDDHEIARFTPNP